MRNVEEAVVAATQVAVAALSSADVADNLEPVLAALMVAMRAELGGYWFHDTLGSSWPVLILPREAYDALPGPARSPQLTSVGVRIHPGWEHCARQRAAPFAVTDVVSERAWQSSEAAALMRPHWGRQFQFAIPVYSRAEPTTFWAWVFGRSGRDFDARDHEVARLVRPVLAQVTRHHARAVRTAPRADAAMRSGAPLLTDRERAVLRLLARSGTAGQIGQRLGISPRTVHEHVEHVYRKLGVHDRRDALDRARALGVLDDLVPRPPLRMVRTDSSATHA